MNDNNGNNGNNGKNQPVSTSTLSKFVQKVSQPVTATEYVIDKVLGGFATVAVLCAAEAVVNKISTSRDDSNRRDDLDHQVDELRQYEARESSER